MLLASSASAGQRLAICAVSNCVRASSLRSVLCETEMKRVEDTGVMHVLSDCRGRIGRVELREGLHVFKRFVVDPASRCEQTKEKMT